MATDVYAKLRRLAAEASPGEWFWNSYSLIDSTAYREEEGDPEEELERKFHTYVCSVQAHTHGDMATPIGAANAAYIEAAQPRIVIALLDALAASEGARRQAEARIETLVATVDRWREDCEGEYRNRVAAEARERGLREAISDLVPAYHSAYVQGTSSIPWSALGDKVDGLIRFALSTPPPSRPEPPAENDLLAIRDEANLALVAIADDGTGDAAGHVGNVVRIVGDLLGRPELPADGLREALADLLAFIGGLADTDIPVIQRARAALAAAPVAEGRGEPAGEETKGSDHHAQ